MLGFYFDTTGRKRKLIVRKTAAGFSWSIPKDWARDKNGLFIVALPKAYFSVGSLRLASN